MSGHISVTKDEGRRMVGLAMNESRRRGLSSNIYKIEPGKVLKVPREVHFNRLPTTATTLSTEIGQKVLRQSEGSMKRLERTS